MGSSPQADIARLAASVSNEVLRHWDVATDRISWHGNVGAYLGSDGNELPGDRNAFLQRVHPDHRSRVRDALDDWLASGSESCSITYPFRGPEGGWMEVREQSRVLRDEDQCPRVVVASMLALGRRRPSASGDDGPGSDREARSRNPEDRDMYRALAENVSDVITVMAHSGEILYESPSVKRVLGFEPDELVGRNAFELIHPEDQERVAEAWKARPGDAGFVDVVEYRCLHADGSWRYLESSGRRPPEDADIEGVLVISRDVSERRELEQRLQEVRKLEAVGRLVSGIAHDFNNLLTVITCNTDILLQELDGHALEEEVEEIRESARRAGSLTRDLLAFGRQENLRLREVELVRAYQDLAPLVEEELGNDIEFELDARTEEAWVRVDPALARQVLFDLVANARDAMPQGGKFRIGLERVRVEPDSPATKWGVEPGDWIVESYEDTGQGMPEAVRERAFEPFFSTKDGGSGLGLSTVYGLVKQSDGELWIESTPGEGTTVHIYLPDVSAQVRMDSPARENDEDAPARGSSPTDEPSG